MNTGAFRVHSPRCARGAAGVAGTSPAMTIFGFHRGLRFSIMNFRTAPLRTLRLCVSTTAMEAVRGSKTKRDLFPWCREKSREREKSAAVPALELFVLLSIFGR
jgi:hypothetical protein